MKHFQIEDAKTRFFNSKEHYLNFKQAWKDFHNNGDHIKWSEWETPTGRMAKTKCPLLNSSHYMLYNLLRGYDISRGFTEHGENGWAANEEAASHIIRTARRLDDINTESNWGRKWAREAVDKMLLPFGDTVSSQMLYDLSVELYAHLSGQTLPPLVIEEQREIEKLKPEECKSFADKVNAWRAA